MKEVIGSGFNWVAKNIVSIVVVLIISALFTLSNAGGKSDAIVGTMNPQGIWMEMGVIADFPDPEMNLVCRLDTGLPAVQNEVFFICALVDWDNTILLKGLEDGSLVGRAYGS